MRWWTSDLHFSHANIARFCGRPFVRDEYVDGQLAHVTDVWAMNEAIVANINALVGPEDELWILGDVALGNLDKSLLNARRFAAGRTVIVTGNHDRCHPYNKKKAAGWLARYERLTGAEIINGNTELTLMDGTPVQVSHFPYSGNSYTAPPREGRPNEHAGEDRFTQWRPVDTGGWLLCGHVHEKWRQRSKAVNVGVDAWGGQPVAESELVALIAEGPADRGRIQWHATGTQETQEVQELLRAAGESPTVLRERPPR